MSPNEGPSPRRGPSGDRGRPGRPSGAGGKVSGGKGSGGRGADGGKGRPGAPGSRDEAGEGRRDDGEPVRGSRPAGGGSGRPGSPGSPGRLSGRRGAKRADGSAGAGGGSRRPAPRDEGPKTAGPKQWGSLGRRGAGRLSDGPVDNRNAIGASGRDERPNPKNEQVRWERVEEVPKVGSGAVRRSRGGPAGDPADLAPKERRGRAARKAGAGTGGAVARDELVSALGATRGARANDRLRDAAHAFERERFEESRSLLRPIAEAAPQASSVRELLGLTYYRLGRWTDAVRELEAFRQFTGSTEQHPVLADAYRALKRRRQVEELWDELRENSPSADLVTEGRIVMAGSLADQGNLRDAIALLERSQRTVKRAEIHNLRQAYALADLYERAGDVARARELFRWVLAFEPNFADAAGRAGSLG